MNLRDHDNGNSITLSEHSVHNTETLWWKRVSQWLRSKGTIGNRTGRKIDRHFIYRPVLSV